MSLDPYKTLGVDKKASPEAIKKAYRTLARQYHPDVNPGDKKAEEKFKELSMAYDILSDPQKKTEYDNLGQEQFYTNFNNGAGYQADFDNLAALFEQLMGRSTRASSSRRGGSRTSRSSPFDFGFESFSRPQPVKGNDVENALKLDFREAVKGLTVTMELDLPQQCPRCRGKGRADNGGGSLCLSCQGKGVVSARETIKTRIPAGVQDKQKIRLRGKGGPGQNGGPPGDLLLSVNIAPDPVFTRDADNNLFEEKKISLYMALLGGKVEVQTISGTASLRIPAGTQNGAKFRIKGQGVASEKKTGDLYVLIKIVLPKNLSSEAGEMVEKLQELAPVADEDL
ncbi:MAG: DnaJ domain-containing protein [Deltaproteobacteria bacterium]|jgi:DnaJ-class molecular chaperone|nr:DnaJ domain-containing protein [Deltaproteobacteria bacterium]